LGRKRTLKREKTFMKKVGEQERKRCDEAGKKGEKTAHGRELSRRKHQEKGEEKTQEQKESGRGGSPRGGVGRTGAPGGDKNTEQLSRSRVIVLKDHRKGERGVDGALQARPSWATKKKKKKEGIEQLGAREGRGGGGPQCPRIMKGKSDRL